MEEGQTINRICCRCRNHNTISLWETISKTGSCWERYQWIIRYREMSWFQKTWWSEVIKKFKRMCYHSSLWWMSKVWKRFCTSENSKDGSIIRIKVEVQGRIWMRMTLEITSIKRLSLKNSRSREWKGERGNSRTKQWWK